MTKPEAAAKLPRSRRKRDKAEVPKPDDSMAVVKAAAEAMSPRARADLDRAITAFLERPNRPRANLAHTAGKGFVRSAIEGEDETVLLLRQMNALGTTSVDFVDATLANLLGVLMNGRDGSVSSKDYNAALAFVAAVEPQNEMEAALAVQMYAANESAMRSMKMMGNAFDTDQLAAFGGLANKFMRTFAVQMEALAKLRRGGEQVVKHVHVYEGGQAVIAGSINQRGGGGQSKDGRQSDATNAVAGSAALPRPHPEGNGVPLSFDAERPMSYARRDESGSADREQERMEARPPVEPISSRATDGPASDGPSPRDMRAGDG